MSRRNSSSASAARFFTLRSGRRIKLDRVPPTTKPRPTTNPIPEQWRFVEKHVPGCFATWVATVGIPTDGMTLGIAGRPYRVFATDEACYGPGYTGCRCRKFVDGTWIMRPHRPVTCCARQAFGDGRHSPECSAV